MERTVDHRTIGLRNRAAARRRELLDTALAGLRANGRVPHVALYALAEPGEDPSHDLAACHAYAIAQGWTVEGTYADHTGRISRPAARPEWRRVQERVSTGFVDGIVAVNQATITMDQTDYGLILDGMVRTFLALVPIGTPR